MIFLDTHVAIWLHDRQDKLISDRASEAMKSMPVRISPIVLLEMEFLHEIGRITATGQEVATALAAEWDVQQDGHPFASVVRHAIDVTWTRDPFDRMIVGHTIAASGTLVTRDDRIRKHFKGCVW